MEASLYPPVKAHLEALGFSVKGEVVGCDLVAVQDGGTVRVAVAELKRAFNLELVLQAVDRMAGADEVWVAVAASKRGRGREHDRRVKKLCRLLGVGLLIVLPRGGVEVIVAPEPYAPRRDARRRSRLLAEHRKRQGDPSVGGVTRRPIMTAYRQQALACAATLATAPARLADLKPACPDAASILQRNVYGWFERVDRGVYRLTDAGRAALVRWPVAAPASGRSSSRVGAA
jgi:hypothetical protein